MEFIAFILALTAILFEALGMGWVGSAFAFLTIIAIVACHILDAKEV